MLYDAFCSSGMSRHEIWAGCQTVVELIQVGHIRACLGRIDAAWKGYKSSAHTQMVHITLISVFMYMYFVATVSSHSVS